MAVSLNADLGESYGSWSYGADDALLDVVTDANVACGFHGGDPDVIRRTCALAAERGVRIGAHPGFQDLRGFGRRHFVLPKASLVNDIVYQLGAVAAFAKIEATPIGYVKPHGALYHAAVAHEEYAAAVVEAVRAFDPALPLLVQPGTLLARHAADHGVRVLAEGFIDRRYTAGGLLVPRDRPGAVIEDRETAVRQAVRLVHESAVDSLCVHSDSPGAAELARNTRKVLEDSGVELRSVVE